MILKTRFMLSVKSKLSQNFLYLGTLLIALIRFPDNVDLKIMHIVGKQMPAVARNETNILEHLREDDLLDTYYSTAMGAIAYTTYLARIAVQIANRYPHMKILEIGSLDGLYFSYVNANV